MTEGALADAADAVRAAIADALAAIAPDAAVTTGPHAAGRQDAARAQCNVWAWDVAADPVTRGARVLAGAPDRRRAATVQVWRMRLVISCWGASQDEALRMLGAIIAGLAARPVLSDRLSVTMTAMPEALLPLLAAQPADAPCLCIEARITAG